jgi:hypothetical protein
MAYLLLLKPCAKDILQTDRGAPFARNVPLPGRLLTGLMAQSEKQTMIVARKITNTTDVSWKHDLKRAINLCLLKLIKLTR